MNNIMGTQRQLALIVGLFIVAVLVLLGSVFYLCKTQRFEIIDVKLNDRNLILHYSIQNCSATTRYIISDPGVYNVYIDGNILYIVLMDRLDPDLVNINKLVFPPTVKLSPLDSYTGTYSIDIDNDININEVHEIHLSTLVLRELPVEHQVSTVRELNDYLSLYATRTEATYRRFSKSSGPE